ncbi:uncharacterized protein LOC143242232 [Tachypleus tridentatus]|uniref:uncharacterized protein LOC143242232 n=1 Tax=Tachypleus tridentatus TaxID=6853 RepID=UPI003FD691AB
MSEIKTAEVSQAMCMFQPRISTVLVDTKEMLTGVIHVLLVTMTMDSKLTACRVQEGLTWHLFAADACVACPDDEITDEEGADNKDLCRNRIEVVSKATLHLTSKSTVPRCAWRTALILMCLTALW